MGWKRNSSTKDSVKDDLLPSFRNVYSFNCLESLFILGNFKCASIFVHIGGMGKFCLEGSFDELEREQCWFESLILCSR